MPQQTIRIRRRSYRTPAGVVTEWDTIDGADVEGCFAVHESIPTSLESWSVTHIPTGYLLVRTETKGAAFAARRAFLASGCDWSFTDPAQIPADCKVAGAMIKRKWGGR